MVNYDWGAVRVGADTAHAAIEDAKTELAEVRRLHAAGKAELTKLAGQLGSITRSAKALERKIEAAQNITEVAEQYKALGMRLTNYMDQLAEMHQKRLQRLRREDDELLQTIIVFDSMREID